MAFTGNGTALTGDDGFLSHAVFGSEIAGDGATPLPVGTYMVTAVAASSGFPAPVASGASIAAGDFLVVETGITITPEIGDDVVEITLTDQCDISSWTMEFSKDEIDITRLCNNIKVYRAGKADMSGTIAGVYTTGVTNSATGKLREFITLANQDGSNSFDKFAQQENIILGFFYLNVKTGIADKQYVVAPYQLYANGIGGEQGSPQSFSGSFRFTTFTYTSATHGEIELTPTLYRLGDGS
jgi:hypothetical protein